MNLFKKLFGGDKAISFLNERQSPYIDSVFTFDVPSSEDPRDWKKINDLKDIPTLYEAGMLIEAETKLEAALTRYSDMGFLYNWLGIIHEKHGHLDKAREAFERGIEVSLEKEILCGRLALFEFDHSTLSEAVKWWIRSALLQLRSQRVIYADSFLYLAFIAEVLGEDKPATHLRSASDTGIWGSITLSDKAKQEVQKKVALERSPEIQKAIRRLSTNHWSELRSLPTRQADKVQQASHGSHSQEDSYRKIRCTQCRAEAILPKTTPPFGNALVCPKCLASLVPITEHSPGCPTYYSPESVWAFIGYNNCSLEHPCCPLCRKINYSVIFPDQGLSGWYVNREPQNPDAFVIDITCVHCGKNFVVEWDEFPIGDKVCNYCLALGIGIDFLALPESGRSDFERDYGQGPQLLAQIKKGTGEFIWLICASCVQLVLRRRGIIPRAQAQCPDGADELLPLIRDAYTWGLNHDWPLPKEYPQYAKIREIGQHLYDAGGHEAMVAACQWVEASRHEFGPLLSIMWHGVGSWLH